MIFTIESQTVKNFVLLITKGLKTIDDVPDLFNLREVVQSVLNG
jgi:hypothetical protein